MKRKIAQNEPIGRRLLPLHHGDHLGRFLQPDPIVADPYDPQTLNRYAYVLNDPANRVDPTGLVPLAAGDLAGITTGLDAETFFYGTAGSVVSGSSGLDVARDLARSGSPSVLGGGGMGGLTESGNGITTVGSGNTVSVNGRTVAGDRGQSQGKNPFSADSEPDAHGLWESTPAIREDIAAALENVGESFPTEDWGNPDDSRFTHIQNEESHLLAARGWEPGLQLLNQLSTEAVRTSGLHPRNIRFDRIHLTYDPGASGGLVPRIHADRFSPYPGRGNLALHGLEVLLPGL